MSEGKRPDIDSREILVVLDRLSRMIVKTNCVVDRLRRHLAERLEAQPGADGGEGRAAPARPPDAVEARRRGLGRDRTDCSADPGWPAPGFPDGKRRVLH